MESVGRQHVETRVDTQRITRDRNRLAGAVGDGKEENPLQAIERAGAPSMPGGSPRASSGPLYSAPSKRTDRP